MKSDIKKWRWRVVVSFPSKSWTYEWRCITMKFQYLLLGKPRTVDPRVLGKFTWKICMRWWRRSWNFSWDLNTQDGGSVFRLVTSRPLYSSEMDAVFVSGWWHNSPSFSNVHPFEGWNQSSVFPRDFCFHKVYFTWLPPCQCRIRSIPPFVVKYSNFSWNVCPDPWRSLPLLTSERLFC